MFKASLWMQEKGAPEADKLADAVVLEVGEPNDPVLINERFGWDDKWFVLRVIPGFTELTDRIEQDYWGAPCDVNHYWLAVDPEPEIKGVEEMERMSLRPQFTGTWLRGDDTRCRGLRLLVFRSRWVVNVEHTKLFGADGRVHFMPGRIACSDVPESP